jgi:SAM-dependent methyltransferase
MWKRSPSSSAAVREAALRYFTDAELEHGRFHGERLQMFDARFELREGELRLTGVPDNEWLIGRVAELAPEEAIWEVVAFIKVRRISTGAEIVERARTGELYDESYFTKRGGGAPYVGYPLELNGYDGNFAAIAQAVVARYRPQRLLDVGAATGEMVKAYTGAGVDAQGLDFSQWAVEHRVIDTVVQGSALALPWDADTFDLVTSQDFMEHMHPDDLPAVIAEQARVAVPGGTILHLIPFYDTDPPVQLDAHLCQATQDWWMRFLRAQPGVEVAREPVEAAPDVVDRYVELRAL